MKISLSHSRIIQILDDIELLRFGRNLESFLLRIERFLRASSVCLTTSFLTKNPFTPEQSAQEVLLHLEREGYVGADD